MGISSVAVYSDSDKNSLHVKEADEAIYLGSSPAGESYLNIEKIVAAAKRVQADAIHPGYGFLAENAGFAKRCEDEKIIFIGPSSGSIAQMGSKAGAKEIMKKNGVPTIPGYEGEEQSIKKLSDEAEKIGFPVLIKASAGGGGKGMRIVRKKEELKSSVETAQREAGSAFGNKRLILEKYFDSCRHVEFQIFGDNHGNAIHLFERECTIQRRHQKIIEESPSPAMTEGLREKMGEAAVKAARAINYSNAGTIEFILNEKNEFLFLEVNTRLQVEHPVTEMITGLDLVRMQIEIAEGMNLNDILPQGISGLKKKGAAYACEVRLYAENPDNNFLPQTGKILLWKPADAGDVRFDSGISTGSAVDVYYDPMLAKVIAGGKDRKEAIRKMIYALKNTACLGIITNKEYLIRILQTEDFAEGNYNTHFVDNLNKAEMDNAGVSFTEYIIAAFLQNRIIRNKKDHVLKNIPSGWRNNRYMDQKENYMIGEKEIAVSFRNTSENQFMVSLDGAAFQVELVSSAENCISFSIGGHLHTAFAATLNSSDDSTSSFIHLPSHGQVMLKLVSRFPGIKEEESAGSYKSPMPGEVVKMMVKPGDEVKKGDALLVLLSMKMENTVMAHSDGTVEALFVNEKSFVQADTVLLKMK